MKNIRDYIYKYLNPKEKGLLYLVSYVFLFLLSFLSWNYFGLLFFINGVFLFAILDKYADKKFFKFILHSFLYVLSWALGALFWMFSIDQGAYGFLIILILSLIPFILFFYLKKIFKKIHILSFIPIWILYEIFHNFSSISFPWLTLGNLFSTNIYLIQWYHYTGVLGGSLWFLILCYFLYYTIATKTHNQYRNSVLLVFFPLTLFSLYSFFIKQSVNDKVLKNKTFITFNNEKTSDSLNGKDLAFYILKKTRNIKAENKVLIIPETTFKGLNVDKFQNHLVYKFLEKIITENGFQEVYFGTSMYKSKQYITNGSVFITNSTSYTKTKEKLIIFNEYVPKIFSSTLNKKKFNPLAKDTSKNIVNDLGVLPLICYEAFYSYYVLQKNKDAKIMYLLSSEKFFNNSVWGAKQYNNILKLRCIENKIPMIKSSNYGKTLVINSKGKVLFKSSNDFNVFAQ